MKMDNIGEKISYLKGLAEGLQVGEATNEGKIISGILEVLGELYDYAVELEDDLSAIGEELAAIDEDLSNLEDECYGEDYDDDDDDGDDGDDDLFELTCEKCGQQVYADSRTLEEDDVYCPNCKEKIEIDLSGCDCGCEHE
jgi:hypothetical protein